MTISIQELLDREAIRDLLADYSVSKDLSPDLMKCVNAFHPQGTLELTNGTTFTGREAIHAFFRDLQQRRAGGPEAFSRHWLYTCRFEFPAPAEAKTISYLISFTETGLDQLCTYRDDLVKEGDAWTIKHRKISMEFLNTDSRLDLPFTVARVKRSQ